MNFLKDIKETIPVIAKNKKRYFKSKHKKPNTNTPKRTNSEFKYPAIPRSKDSFSDLFFHLGANKVQSAVSIKLEHKIPFLRIEK